MGPPCCSLHLAVRTLSSPRPLSDVTLLGNGGVRAQSGAYRAPACGLPSVGCGGARTHPPGACVSLLVSPLSQPGSLTSEERCSLNALSLSAGTFSGAVLRGGGARTPAGERDSPGSGASSGHGLGMSHPSSSRPQCPQAPSEGEPKARTWGDALPCTQLGRLPRGAVTPVWPAARDGHLLPPRGRRGRELPSAPGPRSSCSQVRPPLCRLSVATCIVAPRRL